MPTGNTSKYPPQGLLRIAFRIPVYFYRLKLGWLLGGRFVLINHIGRETGLPRHAVVEVIEREKENGSVIVVAGYGQQTQWYQNLMAQPNTIIQIGSRKFDVTADFVTPEDGEEIMGNHTRVKVVKNKVAPPFRKAEFDIMYGEGISKTGEIIDLGVNYNIIKKSGSWFSYGETKLGQGREAVKNILRDNHELAHELETKIIEAVATTAMPVE